MQVTEVSDRDSTSIHSLWARGTTQSLRPKQRKASGAVPHHLCPAFPYPIGSVAEPGSFSQVCLRL